MKKGTKVKRSVRAILAMELPKPKPKRKPVSVNEIISVLDRFDKKIDVALFISDK